MKKTLIIICFVFTLTFMAQIELGNAEETKEQDPQEDAIKEQRKPKPKPPPAPIKKTPPLPYEGQKIQRPPKKKPPLAPLEEESQT